MVLKDSRGNDLQLHGFYEVPIPVPNHRNENPLVRVENVTEYGFWLSHGPAGRCVVYNRKEDPSGEEFEAAKNLASLLIPAELPRIICLRAEHEKILKWLTPQNAR